MGTAVRTDPTDSERVVALVARARVLREAYEAHGGIEGLEQSDLERCEEIALARSIQGNFRSEEKPVSDRAEVLVQLLAVAITAARFAGARGLRVRRLIPPELAAALLGEDAAAAAA